MQSFIDFNKQQLKNSQVQKVDTQTKMKESLLDQRERSLSVRSTNCSFSMQGLEDVDSKLNDLTSSYSSKKDVNSFKELKIEKLVNRITN